MDLFNKIDSLEENIEELLLDMENDYTDTIDQYLEKCEELANKVSDTMEKTDEGEILSILRMRGSEIFNYAPKRLMESHEFMLDAVKVLGSTFRFAAEELRKDREFFLIAFAKKPNVFAYAGAELKSADYAW